MGYKVLVVKPALWYKYLDTLGELMKKYTNEEAIAESLKYFNGDELAANVWVDKYALRDKDDNLLEKSPEDRLLNVFWSKR